MLLQIISVYSSLNRITKQWWGATHFRLGSRNQPRPNKGFDITQFKNLGEAIEYCRWWKRLRRGTLSDLLNTASDKTSSEILTAKDIENVENGKSQLNNNQLSTLSNYLGVDLIKKRKKRFKFI